MATAFNSIVYVYKGVPLVKDGIEVLYESQSTAVSKLENYLHKTYFQYYYVREERRYIRVKEVMGTLEGCNYLAFINPSNGNRWFFGFIDRLAYLNDNTVEIEFTIDPFPTYLEDTTPHVRPYIIRKTVTPDTDYAYNEEDVDIFGMGVQYEVVSHNTFTIAKCILMFTCDTTFTGTGTVKMQGYDTGIQYKENPSVTDVQQIVEAGGQIMGCYAVDSNFTVSGSLSGLEISPSLSFVGTHAKLKGGQYNKISVVSGGVAKEYDLMKFTNKPAIKFYIKRLFNPAPCIAVYPLNYEGVAENTAEGIVIPYPSIAMNYQDLMSVSTAFSNFAEILKNTSKSFNTEYEPVVMSNAFTPVFKTGIESGGLNASKQLGQRYQSVNETASYRPVSGLQALLNMGGVANNIRKAAMPSAGINTSAGNLVLNTSNQIIIDVVHAHHYSDDASKLDAYFDYFGYSINAFDYSNTTDGAYLQTGTDFLYGSEADEILNTRIKRGIKIRRTLA